MQELPWNMGGFLLPKDATDARLIGLNRFMPSMAQQLAASLNHLVTTIKAHDVWLRLKESYQEIERRPNLDKKLRRIMVRFGREMEKLSRPKLSKSAWHLEADKLAQRLYSRGGARIRSYMESFLEYERLIERIYWLLSQLVMHECISCITSAMPQQLQQVSLGYGKRRRLTALSETSVKTLEVGQLVHISLAETGHLMDGLYQVEQWYAKHQAGIGARILFRARCLWYCELEDLKRTIGEYADQTFLTSEGKRTLGEWQVIIGPQSDTPKALNVGADIPELELTKTMYLP